MLVLSRKISETIEITTADGQVVRVTIVNIKGNRATIGVAAPNDVKILRGELKELSK